MLVPIFELFYDKKNITKDVSPYVTSIEYTDVEHGESDELLISFEDSEKLRKAHWPFSNADSKEIARKAFGMDNDDVKQGILGLEG